MLNLKSGTVVHLRRGWDIGMGIQIVLHRDHSVGQPCILLLNEPFYMVFCSFVKLS